eukprot:g5022.t1
MGAQVSVEDHVRREYLSLVKDQDREYIVLHELQQLSHSSVLVDFSHIGTLFVLNASRTGRVTLEELLAFGRLCQHRHQLHASHEFKARLQAHCSLALWRHATESASNREAVVDWFVRLIQEAARVKARSKGNEDEIFIGYPGARTADSPPGAGRGPELGFGWGRGLGEGAGASQSPVTVAQEPPQAVRQEEHSHQNMGHAARREQGPGREIGGGAGMMQFAGLDAVEMLHQLFHIQRTHAIDFQTFLDMMQQVGEEMGMMDLCDQRYDDVVPVEVLRAFARDMLQGALQLIAELLMDS